MLLIAEPECSAGCSLMLSPMAPIFRSSRRFEGPFDRRMVFRSTEVPTGRVSVRKTAGNG